MIREFRVEDIDAVSALRLEVFGTNQSAPLEVLKRHFHQVFFENPWGGASGCSSYVWEEDDESIGGFIGVLPRPMTFDGQPLRGVVGTQLMVHPERASAFAGVHLLRALFACDCDVILTDGATSEAAAFWESGGGDRLWLQSLKWSRTLRPAREVVRIAGRSRPGMRMIARALDPVLALVDSVFARLRPNRFRETSSVFSEDPLTPESLIEGARQLPAHKAVRMAYDEASLAWILERARENSWQGELLGAVLRDECGAIRGWYIYYLNPRRGTSEVLQVVGMPGSEEDVLAHLFASAWKRGAVSLRGTMDTRLADAINERHGRFRLGAPWTMCYSKRPDVLAALHRGDAQFSRLDMEFWMQFARG